MTINEFLTARFDEEESTARIADGASSAPGEPGDGQGAPVEIVSQQARHIARWSPARVLDDIAAKRQIVALLVEHQQAVRDGVGGEVEGSAREHLSGLEVACNILARPYSWHDDFNSDWDA